MRLVLILLIQFIFIYKGFPQVQLVTTIAGDSKPLDGSALNAQIGPFQIVAKDSVLFFSDRDFTSLRKMSLKTKKITTLLTNQQVISAIAISHGGDSVFFATNGNIIKLFRRSTGISTALDTLPDTELDGLVCDRKGRLIIAGAGHRVIIRDSIGQYRVLAGKLNVSGSIEGLDTVARFNKISGLLLSRTEDTLYISDRFNSRIRRLIRSTKIVSSLPNAPVFGPRQLAFNKRRDTMYIANASGHTIVRYAVRSNQGLTWCGQNATFGYLDGNLGASRFYYPLGICQSDSGLIVCDNSNRRLRQISTSGRVKTFAGVGVIGDGIGINSRFSTPYDILKHPLKDTLYVSDQNNHAIRFINLRNGVVKTIAGNGFAGNTFGIGQNAVLNRPFNMAISRTGDSLYFTEPFSNKIKLLLTKTGEVKWVAGSDTSGFLDKPLGRFSRFNRPQDIALRGNLLYVADVLNHKIRTINVVTTAVSTYAGSSSGFKDSTLLGARFNRPISVEWVGNKLFVGEDGGLRVRVINPDSGSVKVWAGNGNLGLVDGIGTQARFRGISKITYNPLSKSLFVAGFQNEGIIRTVGVETPVVSTFLNSTGFGDGFLTNAKFTGPIGFFIDSVRRQYYVTDANNNRIRKISVFPNSKPSAVVDTLLSIKEDEGLVFKSGFANAINPGLTFGDTLQKVSFLISPLPQILSSAIDTLGKLSLQSQPDSNGTFRLKIILKDNGGTGIGGVDTSVYFSKVRILPVNDPPSFSVIESDTANRNFPRIRHGFLTSLKPGPWDERSQDIIISVTNDQPSYFQIQPYFENDTLKFTPNSSVLGLVNCFVKIKDNGGIDNGGIDSTAKSFTILLFDPLSVDKMFSEKWVAFPIPAKEELRFINFPKDSKELAWYNSLGQKMEQSLIVDHGNYQSVVVPSKVKNGIFQIKSLGGKNPASIRVVIE